MRCSNDVGSGWHYHGHLKSTSMPHRLNEDRSDYVILDVENLSSGPLATIALPHRVPFTPHGNWRSA